MISRYRRSNPSSSQRIKTQRSLVVSFSIKFKKSSQRFCSLLCHPNEWQDLKESSQESFPLFTTCSDKQSVVTYSAYFWTRDGPFSSTLPRYRSTTAKRRTTNGGCFDAFEANRVTCKKKRTCPLIGQG